MVFFLICLTASHAESPTRGLLGNKPNATRNDTDIKLHVCHAILLGELCKDEEKLEEIL